MFAREIDTVGWFFHFLNLNEYRRGTIKFILRTGKVQNICDTINVYLSCLLVMNWDALAKIGHQETGEKALIRRHQWEGIGEKASARKPRHRWEGITKKAFQEGIGERAPARMHWRELLTWVRTALARRHQEGIDKTRSVRRYQEEGIWEKALTRRHRQEGINKKALTRNH